MFASSRMSGSTRPSLPPGRRDVSTFDGGIRNNSVDQDIDVNADHVTVDILHVTDEVAPVFTAPLLRVETENHLARNFLEDGRDEVQPLLQDQLATRIDLTEQAEIGDLKQAAAKTFWCSRLASSFLRYLWVGYQWITTVLALGLYAMFLMPGFVQVGYRYFFSNNIRRGIVYGNNARNRLDLYLPEDVSSPKQVVIFVTGGAWIIGYKAWGALLGIQLSERDVMVCCVDYRNFPQGKISDMVQDVSTSIGFIVNNIDQFGGDPDRIYLAGQSAGSQIGACALVAQAQIEIGKKETAMTWKTSQIKAFLGVSGGVMEGETSLPLYSPELAVQSEEFVPAVPLLPPIYLFHGTGDSSIPSEASESFGSVLQQVGATVATKLYPGKTHTDVILQDPMRGGHDAIFDDFMAVFHADDEEAQARDTKAPLRPRLVPEVLLYLAHVVSPF